MLIMYGELILIPIEFGLSSSFEAISRTLGSMQLSTRRSIALRRSPQGSAETLVNLVPLRATREMHLCLCKRDICTLNHILIDESPWQGSSVPVHWPW